SMNRVDSVAKVAGADGSGKRQRTKAIVKPRVFC
ncbi:23S rRNA (guanosine(2251)-2'-O)-methyltransferase RlmB, partial [Francisella tularensis subsp. holarctica]|nr:23S rRNA (guanosine(2251)-2'-O)-methyltransferase RlmB [Francisella tularensis subsp. holarctica]